MKTNPIPRILQNDVRRVTCAAILVLMGLIFLTWPARPAPASSDKIPVILDTDIGDDIDDTWALGLLLSCPEFDVKLVLGDQGKNLYRARLIAKFLERAGRTDIPVGIGLDANATGSGRQAEWVKDYNLNRYPGKIYPDGVRALIDIIMSSPKPVTVIAIGPLPNVAAALALEPRIAQRARFVGMHGSVRLGYGGSKKISAEYNVRADAKACAKVLSAPWEVTITPLDTCGLVHLEGELYRRVRDSRAPIPSAIIENYRIWSRPRQPESRVAEERSSTLFDTVAVYLAVDTGFVNMERLSIRVTDDGYTRIDPQGKPMNVATSWKDMDGFKRFMVERLTGSQK